MLISVIIPTYNRITLLERAIRSIMAMKYVDVEIIIVDDCSTCNNISMLEKEFGLDKIVYIKNDQNLYAASCRKKGFENSRGDFVVFCDDDDFYIDREFFFKAVSKMKSDKSLAFVSGNANILIEKTNELRKNIININGWIDGKEYFYLFQKKYEKPLSTFTTVFRRKVIEQTVLFFNDSTFYLGALLSGNAYVFSDVIGNYCIHTENISMNIRESFIEESLKSKYDIYNKIDVFNQSTRKNRRWWRGQFVGTLKYYIYGSCIGYRDAVKMIEKMNSRYPINGICLKIFEFFILIRSIYKNEYSK